MKRKKNFISIGCVLWSVAVLAIVMLLVYFFQFGGNLSNDHRRWGEFGGYWWLAHFSRFCHLQIIDIQQYYETMYRDTNP